MSTIFPWQMRWSHNLLETIADVACLLKLILNHMLQAFLMNADVKNTWRIGWGCFPFDEDTGGYDL